jgi:hypothetical protein
VRFDVAAGSLRFEIAARTFLDRKIIQDFAQVTGFRARIGDHLLAVAVIQLLRHQKRLVRGPAPTLAAGFLQGWRSDVAAPAAFLQSRRRVVPDARPRPLRSPRRGRVP